MNVTTMATNPMTINEAMIIHGELLGVCKNDDDVRMLHQSIDKIDSWGNKVDQTRKEILDNPVIGMFANHIGYSDVNPYEIIRVVSKKTLVIKRMKSKRDESVKMEFVPGGFSAHCINQEDQKWFISSNPEGIEYRIRKQKDGSWRDSGGNRYQISFKARKKFDFNF